MSGMRSAAGRPPRVLFVAHVDWDFLALRLPVARAAREAGFEVTVAAADTGRAAEIRREGLSFVPAPIARGSVNPLREARTLAFLARLYRRLRPDLVYHLTIKPVLYGSLAARLAARDAAVVDAITGLGYAFSSERRAGLLRRPVEGLYRLALGGGPRVRALFENPDHRDLFVRKRLVRPERAVVFPGSGVDCERFRPTPEPEGEPLVVLPSRLLWDKGVGEFVAAARLLRAGHPGARFALVGAPDEGSPTTVPASWLREREGVVEWWGRREDMPAVISQSSIVVLPTYYPEGIPRALMEAAASARATVATDTPGCREVVRDGVNGLLVPPRDEDALARAIGALLGSPEMRERFGRAGRELAVNELDEKIVVRRTMDLFRELLGPRWPKKNSRDAPRKV